LLASSRSRLPALGEQGRQETAIAIEKVSRQRGQKGSSGYRKEKLMYIKGRRALVTGAGSGIGRATAVMLAKEGSATIYIADLKEDGLQKTASWRRRG
jgi:FlaA1/EpsC-like NDP-sugar epimerase